ncbi:MAG: hypothetical protein AAFY42_13420, partial [Pseudomonadota bacterium]
MSGGKKKRSSTSSTRTTQNLSPWSQQQFNSRTGRIDAMMEDRPYQAYDQPLVAGLSDREGRARSLFEANMGSFEGDFDEARSMIRSAPTHADFGEVSDKYMNPYTRDVVDVAVDDIHRYNDERNAQSKERALANRAYGGSGYQVAEALNNEAAMREAARTTADLNYRGYNDARGYYDRDIQDQIRRGGLFAELGAREHSMNANDALTLNSLGEVERGIEQDRLGADYNEFLRGEEDFYRRLAVEQQQLAMTPMLINVPIRPGFELSVDRDWLFCVP